jgi:hypothetical protein
MDMESDQELKKLEVELEAKREEELVILIARILVYKILNHAREKGYPVPEIQSGQTELP